MTTDRFFRGFLAALRLRGWDGILHDSRFTAVVEAMPRDDEWPVFIPTPICGFYRELVAARITDYREYETARETYLRGVLARFSDEEQAVFHALAEAYIR